MCSRLQSVSLPPAKVQQAFASFAAACECAVGFSQFLCRLRKCSRLSRVFLQPVKSCPSRHPNQSLSRLECTPCHERSTASAGGSRTLRPASGPADSAASSRVDWRSRRTQSYPSVRHRAGRSEEQTSELQSPDHV